MGRPRNLLWQFLTCDTRNGSDVDSPNCSIRKWGVLNKDIPNLLTVLNHNTIAVEYDQGQVGQILATNAFFLHYVYIWYIVVILFWQIGHIRKWAHPPGNIYQESLTTGWFVLALRGTATMVPGCAWVQWTVGSSGFSAYARARRVKWEKGEVQVENFKSSFW